MDTQFFSDALKKLNDDDVVGIATLGSAAAEEARHPARFLARMLNDPRPERLLKALMILSRLRDLAVIPLLEAPPISDQGTQLWLMQTVAETALERRQQLLDWLRELLDDYEPVHRSKSASIVRVCDYAFLLIGRVLAFGKDSSWHKTYEDAFLQLNPEERDKRIREAKKSRTWPIEDAV
jgi:hypothetical protein